MPKRLAVLVLVVSLMLGTALVPTSAATSHNPNGGLYLPGYVNGNIGSASNVKLDENGVIMVKRGDTYVYNPVTIEQYGLQQHDYFVNTGKPEHLINATIQADWLVANQTAEGKWLYQFDFTVGGFGKTLRAPWSSAMAQGQGMSLLMRIYKRSGEEKYLNSAVRAMDPLEIQVADGGLQTEFFGRSSYYEEYPTSVPNYTLNGFMFTLLGLLDFRTMVPTDRVDARARADALYNSGLTTLVYTLPFHDAKTTSAYHLGHLTNPPRKVHTAAYYHRLHVLQLDALRFFTPNSTMTFYADLWRTYTP